MTYIERAARKHAERMKLRHERLQAYDIKRINRQLRDQKYLEQVAEKVIKGGVL